jgi:hypothetical protein
MRIFTECPTCGEESTFISRAILFPADETTPEGERVRYCPNGHAFTWEYQKGAKPVAEVPSAAP